MDNCEIELLKDYLEEDEYEMTDRGNDDFQLVSTRRIDQGRGDSYNYIFKSKETGKFYLAEERWDSGIMDSCGFDVREVKPEIQTRTAYR